MRSTDPMDDALMQQAAERWAKFQEREPATEELVEWLAWMEQHEAHARAFQSMNELALSIRHTRAAAPELAMRLQLTKRRTSMFRGRLAIAASIAILSIAFLIALGVAYRPGADARQRSGVTYATATAIQREVLLPDGSRVLLGGASAISTDFSAERRRVRLTAGEAYFEVEHEESGRPFIVDVGIATIRAVGTAFNIRKSEARIALTVTAGRVKVGRAEGLLTRVAEATGITRPQTVEVGPAEQVVIEPRSAPLAVAPADPVRATAWRQGRLEFIDEPLDAVIENVSRYSAQPLVSNDPRLHSLTYTGSFDPKHFENWLGALEQVFPVEVDRGRDTTHIRVRTPPP